jgi:transposase
MISIGARRLFVCGQPVDMRKGMDGLASIVLAQLQQDPSSGDIFLFLGKRATSLKALCWDQDGYWLCTKRLAEGRFLFPRVQRSDGRPATVELSEAEWHLLLDGIVVRERVLLRRHHRRDPTVMPHGPVSRTHTHDASAIDVNPACHPCPPLMTADSIG